MSPCHPSRFSQRGSLCLSARCNRSKQPVSVADSGSQVKRVGGAKSVASECERMKRWVHDRVTDAILELTDKVSRVGVKCADGPIGDVADQNIVAEWAEVGARLGDSPRSIQCSSGGKALYEIAFEVKDVDKSVP